MTVSKTQRLLTDFFPKRSTMAWAFIGGFIFVYDVVAIALNDLYKTDNRKYETFSDGCWRGVEHPVARWPIWIAILILVKHLAAPNFLRKYDPIKLVGFTMRFIKKRVSNG